MYGKYLRLKNLHVCYTTNECYKTSYVFSLVDIAYKAQVK